MDNLFAYLAISQSLVNGLNLRAPCNGQKTTSGCWKTSQLAFHIFSTNMSLCKMAIPSSGKMDSIALQIYHFCINSNLILICRFMIHSTNIKWHFQFITLLGSMKKYKSTVILSNLAIGTSLDQKIWKNLLMKPFGWRESGYSPGLRL